jgi:DNA-binding CsgD family transcriptional regulator
MSRSGRATRGARPTTSSPRSTGSIATSTRSPGRSRPIRRSPRASPELVGALRSAQAERSRAAGTPEPGAWRAAIDAWEARDRPYEAAYARWRGAEAQLAAGDRTAARDLLADAWRWASGQGAAPLLAEIETLARRARLDLSALSPADETAAASPAASNAGSPSDRAADEFGLTRREREVLALVAEGWTNRQVADHLFISENTAGVHVSNILGKLGASGRTEAAAIAHRLGLAAEPAEA